jgi:hypothetical protein
MKRVFAVPAALLLMGAVASAPAFAQSAKSSAHQSYFCTLHPSSPQCHTRPPAVKPRTGAGGTYPIAGSSASVTGLGRVHVAHGTLRFSHSRAYIGSQPVTALPSSGGANPMGSDDGLPLVLATLAILSGVTLRRWSR